MDPVNIPAKFEVRSFIQIFKGLLFAWTLPSLKFVALPVPEIIGGTQKMGSPWIRPRFLFSKIFHWLVFGWTLWMYLPNLQSVALAVAEIIVIAVLGWVVNPQSRRRGGRRGSGMAPFERALVTSYRLSIVTFPLSLRVSEILPLL